MVLDAKCKATQDMCLGILVGARAEGLAPMCVFIVALPSVKQHTVKLGTLFGYNVSRRAENSLLWCTA